MAFGPDPEGPSIWVPEEAPLLALPVETESPEELLTAAEAVEMGQPTDPPPPPCAPLQRRCRRGAAEGPAAP